MTARRLIEGLIGCFRVKPELRTQVVLVQEEAIFVLTAADDFEFDPESQDVYPD